MSQFCLYFSNRLAMDIEIERLFWLSQWVPFWKTLSLSLSLLRFNFLLFMINFFLFNCLKILFFFVVWLNLSRCVQLWTSSLSDLVFDVNQPNLSKLRLIRDDFCLRFIFRPEIFYIFSQLRTFFLLHSLSLIFNLNFLF